MENRKLHWEKVYETKSPQEVSWTEEKPAVSLDLIREFELPKEAAIIDIGGGDSKLVDYLLEEGYEDISVLDISEKALERAQERFGNQAKKIQWIVSDIHDFKPERVYALWHDRAVFHFITDEKEQKNYVAKVTYYAERLVLGTFSKEGPLKCSGLEIQQYSEKDMRDAFTPNFQARHCLQVDHLTPFDTVQNFQFCSFQKK